MAIVRVEMSPRPQAERDSIIAGITDVLVAHGSPRENTHVILYEVGYDVWAKGGLTYTARKKTVPQPGQEAGTRPGEHVDAEGGS